MRKLSKEKIKAACDKVRRDVSAMSPEQRQQLERKARQVIAKGKTGALLSDLNALATEWEEKADAERSRGEAAKNREAWRDASEFDWEAQLHSINAKALRQIIQKHQNP